MTTLFEEKAARIAATKKKYAGLDKPQRFSALDVAFKLANEYESMYDAGIIDWDQLVKLRSQGNAVITGLAELMHENNELDLGGCQFWKKRHRQLWTFIDEPMCVTQAVHRQFHSIIGTIAKKNTMLNSLAVLLSKHNWAGYSMLPDKKEQDNSIQALDLLSKQLIANNLGQEIAALWDYYAPAKNGKYPTFSWLIDYIEKVPEFIFSTATGNLGDEKKTSYNPAVTPTPKKEIEITQLTSDYERDLERLAELDAMGM